MKKQFYKTPDYEVVEMKIHQKMMNGSGGSGGGSDPYNPGGPA